MTKNSLHFLVFLWQFFHKKFSLAHTLFQLVFITSNTLLIIFTSLALNKCSIKHKLCTLRDNLNVNSLRADKNESFLSRMEITVLVFFWRIIIVKRLYTERKKGNILLQIPFNYLKARLVFPTVSCQIISTTYSFWSVLYRHVTGTSAKSALQCLPLWLHHKIGKQQTACYVHCVKIDVQIIQIYFHTKRSLYCIQSTM